MKWADYGISAVKYNSTDTHIEKVRVHLDNGDTLEPASEWLRTDVISALEKGKTFVTIIEDAGKWAKGQKVHIIPVDNAEYIRTDTNNTASNNLDKLPKF
ncbi:DUF3892 domain-containing protein [Methanobacterium paludis]|uniref:DUF3892 domain-containing protein n=1 Tax=Methanobacterium paludis (strain DSM 25820 / JCM 18151 / SWAN1) TaxID=868131 RepID=F6D4V7_METPW|nr:DUF3892 domain-containing protein [Methanobacterium paludis]AEG18166.1 hypothetical protein MSWAN_1148 [Methanobacterium paludis]